MNGAELAIISSKFQGVCQQMANTLMRTGRSGVLNTAHDFSCCILDSNNSFITADESLPVHVLSGPDLMANNIDKFHPIKKKGDAFLILPGGSGTIEEATEVISWKILGIHKKPIIIFNFENYWNSMIEMYNNAKKSKFGDKNLQSVCKTVKTFEEFSLLFK